MIKKILQLEANDGSGIMVEIADTSENEQTRGFTDNRGVIENVKESFDNALSPLKQVSNSIINCIKDIANSPKEVEVELGLKFTAKAGIVLTSFDSEAHFRVTLKWTNESLTGK